MGYRGGADATWAIAVLHRFSESGRPVRRFRCGLPSTLYEPERAEKTRRVGNDNAVDLSGHKRYAHIAGLRCDSVLPELLGMNKIISEDAVSDRLITRPSSHLR